MEDSKENQQKIAKATKSELVLHISTVRLYWYKSGHRNGAWTILRMKTHLTSEKRSHFQKIKTILQLRQSSSALILIGASSKELAGEFEVYFTSLDGVAPPSSANILHELIGKPYNGTY